MSFRDNLQHLRATRNMTQEQLAMLVGVSRQSVTKWEAEKSYPEMDKLLKICHIFDCSLDELVQGDLTARQPEPTQAPAPVLADVTGYDEHMRSFALRMGIAVSLFVLAAAVAAFLEGRTPWLEDPDAGSGFAFFALVAAGLLVLIPAVFTNMAFKKAHPFVEDFYTSEEKEQTQRRFGLELAAGIACLLLSLGVRSVAPDSNLSNAGFLVGVAVGVGVIVHSALLGNRTDVEAYNIEALTDISEEEIASIVGEERAPQVLVKVRRERRLGAVCGIIMLVATIVGLSLMFYGSHAHDSFLMRYFWIAWMVGGLLCAIASLIPEAKGN